MHGILKLVVAWSVLWAILEDENSDSWCSLGKYSSWYKPLQNVVKVERQFEEVHRKPGILYWQCDLEKLQQPEYPFPHSWIRNWRCSAWFFQMLGLHCTWLSSLALCPHQSINKNLQFFFKKFSKEYNSYCVLFGFWAFRFSLYVQLISLDSTQVCDSLWWMS